MDSTISASGQFKVGPKGNPPIQAKKGDFRWGTINGNSIGEIVSAAFAWNAFEFKQRISQSAKRHF